MKITINNLELSVVPSMEPVYKEDKRFKLGKRVIGQKPILGYSITFYATSDFNLYLRDIIQTNIGQFYVVSNKNNLIKLIQLQHFYYTDVFNFKYPCELDFTVNFRCIGEGY